jgi:hypothetical protein
MTDETPVITDACGASLSLLLRFQRLFIAKICSIENQKCSQIMSHPGLCLGVLLCYDVDHGHYHKSLLKTVLPK